MTAIIAWFSSTIGKAAAKWGFIAALIAAGYWRIYASGKSAAEAERIAQESLARKKVSDADEKVSSMDDARVRAELDRWVRK